MSWGLSNDVTVISRNMNGPGNIVHKASRDEFVTLYAARSESLEAADNVVVERAATENTLRLIVGEQEHALVFPAATGVLISNLYVYAGTELWISCNSPGVYAIYGTTSKRTMS